MSDTQVDLSRLAVDRTDENSSRDRRKRRWISRYLVPGGILLGFAILIAFAARDSLFPKPTVEVMPVIVKKVTEQPSGTPLFQAAGWIEPRPTAINVPSLAPGVIEELLVVEGQAVAKGEPVAKLISIDAEIAVMQAEAELANAVGDMNRALAEQKAAQLRFDKPVHLQIELADAKSLLARTATEIANLPFQIETAQANLEYAKKSVEGKRAAGNAVPGVVLQKAETELIAADAKLRELQKRKPSLEQERQAIQEKVTALEQQIDLLIEETRQLDEAGAKVQSVTALRDAAKLKLQKAELVLQRNTIRAPIDGRVLRLVASPGARVMGMHTNAEKDSSTVIEMYDPDHLQIRADVRLENVPSVQRGQPVEIQTASSEKTIQGRVLQANSQANIQKNTLEVKVALIDPPETVRPEMLVTATFLAPDRDDTPDVSTQQEDRLFVPKQLLINIDSAYFVWMVDADGRARRQKVSVGGSTTGELVEITSGVTLTDKIIASNPGELSEGMRVKVSGNN